MFLAFATVIYWILNIAKVPFADFFTPFFESIKSIVNIYYSRGVVIDQVTLDFSYLIASLSMIIVVWVFKFVVDFVEDVEKKYDSIHKALKNRQEIKFNQALEKERKKVEKQHNKFLILINFSAKNLSKDKFYSYDTETGCEAIEESAIRELWEALSKNVKFKEAFLETSLLLYFDNFDEIDSVICEINNQINKIKNEYSQKNWQLHYFVGIEVYSHVREIFSKVNGLRSLLNFKFVNEIVCFGTFDQKYLTAKVPKYYTEKRGVFKVGEEEEEVFAIKRIEDV